MKTIMIVDDDAESSQDLRAAVLHSEVNTDEIIVCRNGEEAYDILKRRKIAVLFTDIRLPEMDGFELVKKAKAFAADIRIVIVSSYEEFQYAVEMFRSGVRDYLLKPVEKSKIKDILKKFQTEIEMEELLQTEIDIIWKKEMKYLILNQNVGSKDFFNLSYQFEQRFSAGYVTAVLPEESYHTVEDAAVMIHDIEGSTFLCFEAEKQKLYSAVFLKDTYAGLSLPHHGIAELADAYQEALAARKEAFVKSAGISIYHACQKEYEQIPKELAEHFVQQFGTDRMEEGLKQLSRLFFKAKMHHISTDSLLSLIKEIHQQFEAFYSKIIPDTMKKNFRYQNPLEYKTADLYFKEYAVALKELKQHLQIEFEDYKNKEKIYAAIQYIHKNYHKDLNMAVLSNYVSMNYTLFSIAFKQYVKMNFVKYLKMVRINEAKKLLKETDLKIVNVSRIVGYENEKHFMKTFKSTCGVSPTEYRKNAAVSIKMEETSSDAIFN